MSELKPCPFCGGKGVMKTSSTFSGSLVSSVSCFDCSARGQLFEISTTYSSEAKAVEAWNCRTGVVE